MSIKNLSDTIKAMMAAGCTPEQIGAVLDVHAKADEEERERQREKERLKKRRQRALSPNVPRDTQGHPGTPRDTGDPLSLNGSPPTPYIRNIDNPPSLNPITNKRSTALSQFDRFWSVYPRKIGKGAAQKAWAAAVRKADPDRIIEAVERYAWPDEPSFIPHASTWLNGQRWEDELPNMGPRKPSEEELERMERERLAFLYDLHERTKGNGLQYDDEEA
jgi:hypothetical protein